MPRRYATRPKRPENPSRKNEPMRQALLLAAGAGLLLAAGSAFAAPGKKNPMSTLDDIYKKHGAAFGVDWRLLKAHAQVESGENAGAVNKADNESLGLMQVLCRPDGKGGCANRLNVEGWRETTRARLLDADWNVYIGAQILAWNIRTFGLPKGIAVYNAWDQRNAPSAGPFKNQAYVDKVRAKARALGMEV